MLVSQLRRAGRGHGVFHIDTILADRYDEGGAGGGGDTGVVAGPLVG